MATDDDEPWDFQLDDDDDYDLQEVGSCEECGITVYEHNYEHVRCYLLCSRCARDVRNDPTWPGNLIDG